MKFFEKNELKILWPFYLEIFLSSVIQFIPAFVVVYFVSVGFSLSQIGILMAVIPLFSFVFEIPTGVIADLFGRKISVVSGYFLEGLVFLMVFFVDDYFILVILFSLSGIFSTLYSGSKEAWIYDLIKKKNKRIAMNFFAKEQFFRFSALFLAGIFGAFFVAFLGISVIWLFSFASFMVSFLILLFCKEEYVFKKREPLSFKKFFLHSKKSISYSLKHPVIFYLFVANFFMIVSVVFAESLAFVPFLKGLGLYDYAFGLFWSGHFLIGAVVPLFSKKLLAKHKEVNFLIFSTFFGSLVLLFIYFANNLFFAIFVIFSSIFFFGLKYPVERPYFNKFIPSRMRATIGSFESFIFSIAGVFGLAFGGYLIDVIGSRNVIIISALLGIPTIVAYLLIKEEESKI